MSGGMDNNNNNNNMFTSSNNNNNNSGENPLNGSLHIKSHHQAYYADCIRDGTLAYIYIVENTLLNDRAFLTNPVVPLPNIVSKLKVNSDVPSSLIEITHPLISVSGNNDDLKDTKEIYEYIKFFEIADSMTFHQNDHIKRYSRYHLNLTLKFMGCKSVHARQITTSIFEQLEKCRVIEEQNTLNQQLHNKTVTTSSSNSTILITESVNESSSLESERIHSVCLLRSTYYYIVGHILSTYQYSKPQYISDFPVACDVQEKKHSFTILLGGTSGCGKSTLTALLASRIGFAAVISTDNIRQILRKFISRNESPILWASTYHAGEIISNPSLSHKEKILQGYEAQNDMIYNKLDVLIDHYEKRKESLIVEGVHLDTRLIIKLCKKHPSCIPFLMYISNEDKHKERFAIRSKYMTLDPHQNKYTKYFKNIRIINNYLCQGANSILIPQIDNTSIDRSLATIHGTIFACLKRKVMFNENYFNSETGKLNMLHQEYEQIQHQFWSSKGMLRLIRKKRYSMEQSPHNVETEENFNSDDEEEEESEEEEEGEDHEGSATTEGGQQLNATNTSGALLNGVIDAKGNPKSPVKDITNMQSKLFKKRRNVRLNINDIDDEEDDTSDGSDSESREERVDYYVSCGSLGS